jgi:hypothetical protein
MQFLSRTSALLLMAVPALVSTSFAQPVDVWTVGVNNTRQGWNKFETLLTPANVPKLKKIREFIVDEKIDVSPLVVGNKLYVCTMTNTAYVFDVNTSRTGKSTSRRSVTRSSSTGSEERKRGDAMKIWFSAAALALAAWSGASHAQDQSPVAGTAPASDRLSDLDAMTFSCPKAGLNAAAREASKVPSQGTYQFAYFKIINDSHHATYEIHFKSNYEGEADLKYCVSVYCQQGWDPKTKMSVTLMSSAPQRKGSMAHAASCGHPAAPVNRRLKR